MFPALSFVLTNPHCIFQPLRHLQLTGAQGKGSLLVLSFWQFFWTALRHKLDPSLLIFQWKNTEKGCLKCSFSGYGTDIAQGTLTLRFLAWMTKSKTSHFSLPDPCQRALHPGPEIRMVLLRSSVSIAEYLTIYTKWFGPNRRLKQCLQNQITEWCANTYMFPTMCTRKSHLMKTQFSYQMNCVAELTDPFQTTAITLTGISLQVSSGASTGQPCHACTS